MKKIVPVLFALLVMVYACNNSLPANDFSKKSVKEEKSITKQNDKNDENNEEEKSQPQLLNNISLQTEGNVEVYRAFLAYEDGNLVPSSNTTSIGKTIFLHLNITKGWQEENGMVSIGASETISTDKGRVIVKADDLFGDKMLSASDSKFIQLQAVINSKPEPIEYYNVAFKVWDKKGNGVITGSYRFYVQ